MVDAAIIGSGPAGLSAALTLTIHEKSILWLSGGGICDKVRKAEKILNYPGFTSVSGAELADAFEAQAKAMGLQLEERMLNNIYPMGNSFGLAGGSEVYEAKTLLLSTGVAAVSSYPGEQELLGRGVSYCATCDGALYRNKTIAVYSQDERFDGEIAFLSDLAEKVYLFCRYECTVQRDNIRRLDCLPRKLLGDGRLGSIECSDGQTLSVDGFFILRRSIALGVLLPGLAMEDGHIAVDRSTMASNIPGCFAAGDCTGRPYQYAKAVGEGNVAAHSMIRYLDEH